MPFDEGAIRYGAQADNRVRLEPAAVGWPRLDGPDFSTLSRRQKTVTVNIPYSESKEPLLRLVDSTGIKIGGEGEWHTRKHGGPKRRV